MGNIAARLTDLHTCALSDPKPHVGGPITGPCAPTVLVGGQPQARVTDALTCVGPPDMIAVGSIGVYAEGMPCARLGDMTIHAGVISSGFPTVYIGDVGGGVLPPAPFKGITLPMGIETKGGDPDPMAKAMIAAAKVGAPFSEQCSKA